MGESSAIALQFYTCFMQSYLKLIFMKYNNINLIMICIIGKIYYSIFAEILLSLELNHNRTRFLIAFRT